MDNYDSKHLLTTVQMAEFVHNGFLRFDTVIPRNICDELYAYIDDSTKRGDRPSAPGPLATAWHPDHPCHKAYFNPVIQGALHSLMGPNCRYDHHAAHRTPGRQAHQQHLHQDAQYDPRFEAFDVQISVFPQDTPREMGGTRFLPGSHFRRVYESELARYHNVRGMVQCECEAGTVVIWHHNLWHGAQPNSTDKTRYMVKLRVNPMVRQTLLWDTRDLNSPDVHNWLNRGHTWWGVDGRREIMNKIRFWRALTDQPSFDSAMWLSRVENTPRSLYHRYQIHPPRG